MPFWVHWTLQATAKVHFFLVGCFLEDVANSAAPRPSSILAAVITHFFVGSRTHRVVGWLVKANSVASVFVLRGCCLKEPQRSAQPFFHARRKQIRGPSILLPPSPHGLQLPSESIPAAAGSANATENPEP